MTARRSDSGRDREPVLTPEDRELLAELLPEQDERSGPARRRPHAATEVMVYAVLDSALAAEEQATTRPSEDPSAVGAAEGRIRRIGLRSGRRALALVAASIALLSVGALASALVVRMVLAPKPAPASVRTTPAPPVTRVVEAPLVEEEPEAMVDAQPEVVHIAGASRGPKVRPPWRKRLRASPKVAESREHFVAEVDLTSAPLEDLLALANKLRRSREWRSADEVYGAVIERFPGSDAAVVAQVVSATLHINQLKDARGALEGYRRALAVRPTGALAEEARWGIAAALRVLGDREGELNALREFLDRHAVSALAPGARRRMAELGQ